jgi:competence protein ComGC
MGMRIRSSRQTNQGLTLVEAVVVVSVIAIFAMVLVPAHFTRHSNRHYINCTSNLKELGLDMKIWAGDNNDRFPMQVSVTNGGAMESVSTPDAWKIFQVMSNELSTPKVILCPEDSLRRHAATNFTDDLKNKISYFIGTTATSADPQMLLSGDDNFLLNQSPVKPGLMNMASTDTLGWDETRHGEVTKQGWFMKDTKAVSGNIVLTDGSVQSVTSSGLTNALQQTSLATNHLVIP